MFGAQVGDDLCHLGIGERVSKGGHLFAAIEDLLRDFFRRPGLVGADGGERRTFLGSDAADPVAVLASFITEEDCAGLFVGLGCGAEEGQGKGNGKKCEKK